MGVYSTDAMLDAGMTEWILHHIAVPTIYGMASEDAPFVGVLYCGLMMTARGPQVLEFNARFGDPETQAILMRLESDLVDALEACVDGTLEQTELRWSPGASACVVASSSGYPGSYKTGFPITGPRRRRTGSGGSGLSFRLVSTGRPSCSPQEAACWVLPPQRPRWKMPWRALMEPWR
jgi:phosphoribosylamine-glycine ligase